jgi:TetR/AcrR family transcriptional regulator, transcriptional repressor for nem operon
VSGRRAAGTADRILDVAEGLVQVRGFNAFSYADVSRVLGIQKASLHHHFATKASLGLALVDRYRQEFLASLAAILADSDGAGARLERYVELYGSVLRRRRMCLCGMLAADVATLPKAMRESIEGFFAENEAWLARVLDEGRTRGEIDFGGAAASMAAFFVSSLEGAMLVARGSGSPDHFSEVVRRLLATVKPMAAKPQRRVR